MITERTRRLQRRNAARRVRDPFSGRFLPDPQFEYPDEDEITSSSRRPLEYYGEGDDEATYTSLYASCGCLIAIVLVLAGLIAAAIIHFK